MVPSPKFPLSWCPLEHAEGGRSDRRAPRSIQVSLRRDAPHERALRIEQADITRTAGMNRIVRRRVLLRIYHQHLVVAPTVLGSAKLLPEIFIEP